VTNFQKVAAFHAAMDKPLGLPINHNTLPDWLLCERLVGEEIAEFWTESDDIVATLKVANATVDPALKASLLKEMVDVLYVTYSFAVTFGLDIDTAFDRVHASNMSKLVDGKPLKRVDGKVLKGPNYAAPNLMDLVT
jgi:predicted HAD superfamily Cof-like phosphohydrolase